MQAMFNFPSPKTNRVARLLTTALLLAGAAGCNKAEEVVAPTVSNEAITTLTLTLTNAAAPGDVVTATWEQLLDASGKPIASGPDVSKASLALKPNATYNSVLTLLDKTQTPVFKVSDEIQQRANIHLFFYQPLPSASALVIPASEGYPAPIPANPTGSPLNLTVAITDADNNKTPLPLGLTSQFKTGAASTGYLQVLLRHQPNVKDGTFAPGSTDFNAGFKVAVQ